MRFLASLFLIFSMSAFALEVDEKLTVRLLKTSESKKTIMVNRGTEDGLVEGDHARFIVTAGIVARAVCVKVSPTRSVWSVYRLVNADFIVNDSVMSIKITPPVKITKDESQAIVQEDVPSRVSKDPVALGIPLADGANDLTEAEKALGTSTDEDLKDLEAKTNVEKNIEVFGLVNISGLSSVTKQDTGTNEFKSSQSNYSIGLGGELYPKKEREWYSHLSLEGSVNFLKADAQSYNGSSARSDAMEVGLGTNWHFSKLPSAVMEFIPYVHAGFNIGTAKSTYEPGSENIGGKTYSANGSTTGFSLGFGYKYYTPSGFGVRALLDYYYRGEKYKADQDTLVYNKTVSGPRLQLGIAYRF
jgi:Outer membrane protein beta-barrel domain